SVFIAVNAGEEGVPHTLNVTELVSRHVTGDKKTNKCQKNNRRPLKPAGGIAVPAWRNIRPGQHGHRGQTRCGFGQNRSEERRVGNEGRFGGPRWNEYRHRWILIRT